MSISLLVPVPHRDGRLSGSHSVTAGDEVGAGLQTLRFELQTHEAELHLTARTDDVLAARFVVLHPLTTGGTSSDGGTLVHPLNLGEVRVLAVFQQLQVVVDAAVVAAAVGARSRTFPGLQALPAELGEFLLVCCADCALNTEVCQVLSLHVGLTSRTLRG